MAGPNDKVPTTQGGGLQGIVPLLELIGGKSSRQTTTSSPADPAAIAAFQQVLKEAAAQNYESQLASIFNQAQGAMPKLSAAYGRTMGRSYGNSQLQAALDSLLKQTTLQGQKQIADLEMQNRTLQNNVAANLANSTKGLTSTTSTRNTSPLGTPIAALLAWNAINDVSKGGANEMVKKLLSPIGGAFSSSGGGTVTGAAPAAMAPAVTLATPVTATPVTAAAAPAQPFFNFTDAYDTATNALGQVGGDIGKTVIDLATTPINWVNQGIDYVSQGADNLRKWLTGEN